MKYFRPLLWSTRFAAALGFVSQSMTAEIRGEYLILIWTTWMASLWFDYFPHVQKRLRSFETASVIALVFISGMDYFAWGSSLFVAIAHFLLLFQVIKLVGLKEPKDCLQILLISFFHILSACTLSVDVWQGVMLLIWIPTATAGLFWQQISREMEMTQRVMPEHHHKPYRRLLTLICIIAVPVNIALASTIFVLFPRFAFRGAFLGLGVGKSGYNEQVNLEETGELSQSDKAVLWLQIAPAGDRNRWDGYLRGTTLDVFDGKRWSRKPMIPARTLYSDMAGSFKLGPPARRGLKQTITLVHTGGAVLFGSPFIGEVIAPLSTLQFFEDGSVRWARGLRKPLRYDVLSYPTIPAYVVGHSRDANLTQIPSAGAFQKTRALANQIAGRGSPLSRARAIESHLRNQYRYSLQMGSSPADNPVEDFLFVRRFGPCGHFASAMAVMLRLQGIPARVVSGYYRGVWNERVGQYLVRERDAHAWVEAFIPGMGWVTFDPSPREISAPVLGLWRVRAQEYWQFLNFQWDRMVVEYDLYSQVQVAVEIQSNTQRINSTIGKWFEGDSEQRSRSAIDPRWVKVLIGLGLLTAGVGGVVAWIRRRRTPYDSATAFYRQFLTRMAHRGFPKALPETGWEYAERLKSRPEAAEIQAITSRYYDIRFGTISPKR